MTLTDLASSAARMASCCGNGDLPGGEERSYTPCAWVTPLPPVGSCSRGTASIARPARVQPEMSLDLRPFPSPEEQSDQQPEIPLDLRPFPSLEEERDLAAAPLPPGPPPSEPDVAEAEPAAPRELQDLFKRAIPEPPWQHQRCSPDNKVWQAAAMRRRQHYRRSNVSLGVCTVDLSGP